MHPPRHFMMIANSSSSLQGLVVIYFITHSSYDGVSLGGLPTTVHGGSPKPPASTSPTPDGSAAQAPPAPKHPSYQKRPEVGEKYDAADFPMPMSPSDPGWTDVLYGEAPGPRMNATFVTLARNSDVWEIAKSIREIEDRFNRRYNYDWVFLNDKPFDSAFKKLTTSLVSGNTYYGVIPKDHWSFPDWIDQDKAAKVRQDMAERKIIYGDSVSYRHMCRYESGFFFRHPLMLNYQYYWRVEPSVQFHCDIHYDPFRYMAENNKKYGFVLSLYEYIDTIPTLWDSVKKFMKNHPEHVAADNSMGFLSDDGGDTYNKCHFVSLPWR
jgi:alpha 1,2-mannosyltransferase